MKLLKAFCISNFKKISFSTSLIKDANYFSFYFSMISFPGFIILVTNERFLFFRKKIRLYFFIKLEKSKRMWFKVNQQEKISNLSISLYFFFLKKDNYIEFCYNKKTYTYINGIKFYSSNNITTVKNYIPSIEISKSLPKNKPRILSYRWHCSHQYELFKLDCNFYLFNGLGPSITNFWDYGARPLANNISFINPKDFKLNDFDLAILPFDEFLIDSSIDSNSEWSETFNYLFNNLSIPKIMLCHGTPIFTKDSTTSGYIIDKSVKEKIVEKLRNVLVICNSYQAQKEWGFYNSKVIWHGFDPDEFLPQYNSSASILSLFTKNMIPDYRPYYRGFNFFNEVVGLDYKNLFNINKIYDHEPSSFDNINDFAIKKFKNYRDEITKHSIYFNPTQRSPMPRSRGEAIMSGLVCVSADNHDVSKFIQNGVDGFYSNDKAEIYDALKFLTMNNQGRRKMQIKSRDLAIKYFSLERYHQEWIDALKEYIKV